MQLKWNSKSERKRQQQIEWKQWHKKFAIWPKRINATTVVCLGSYYRMLSHSRYSSENMSFEYITVDEYGDIIAEELRGE